MLQSAWSTIVGSVSGPTLGLTVTDGYAAERLHGRFGFKRFRTLWAIETGAEGPLDVNSFWADATQRRPDRSKL